MGNFFTNTPTDTVAVEFEPGEELGRGAYGRVFKAKYRRSVCAAKEIHSILIQSHPNGSGGEKKTSGKLPA